MGLRYRECVQDARLLANSFYPNPSTPSITPQSGSSSFSLFEEANIFGAIKMSYRPIVAGCLPSSCSGLYRYSVSTFWPHPCLTLYLFQQAGSPYPPRHLFFSSHMKPAQCPPNF